MAAYFFDSSGLTKRYAKEKGTTWVISLFHSFSNNRIHVAEISLVEVISALTRKHRGNNLSSSQYQRAVRRFRRVFRDKFFTTEIDNSLLEEASILAEKYALRGYDAVQLAAALSVQNRRQRIGASSLIFISADNALNIAAQNEGLLVDNPNNHL